MSDNNTEPASVCEEINTTGFHLADISCSDFADVDWAAQQCNSCEATVDTMHMGYGIEEDRENVQIFWNDHDGGDVLDQVKEDVEAFLQRRKEDEPNELALSDHEDSSDNLDPPNDETPLDDEE